MSHKNGCLGLLLGLFGPRAPVISNYSLRCLLSPAERSFLGVLERCLGPEMRAFAKVRLGDLFFAQAKGRNWYAAFNRITAKHVDFVICDSRSLDVLFAVELDDSSHASPKARRSDEFKDALFRSCGLRLLRIKVQRSYSVAELKAALFVEPPPLPHPRPSLS